MGAGGSVPAAYMAEEREKRKKEQEDLKQTVEDNIRYLTDDIVERNTELAERANVAKAQLEDEVVKLKAELRRAIHSETTLKKENKKLAAELEKLQTVVDNLPKTTEQLKEQRRANKALSAENEALAEQIKKYEGMEQAMRALKQKQKDMEEDMERMQRKVERAEAVQQVNKTLTLRADNLQADVDRLSSLLEKAATSEQIRKSLTQEEVRKMKVMASKVAMNDKALSRRNRELETQVAQLQKQLSVHKGYKAAAVKNKELENTIDGLQEQLKGASMQASDGMVSVLIDRKPTLEREVVFLKAQVKKYAESSRDRNDKARRVDELEGELDHVSKPFLSLSRSVTGMNKDIEGMIGKLNNDLQVEVNGLQQQMERAVLKVKETETLNDRVREYEALLAAQHESIREAEVEAEKEAHAKSMASEAASETTAIPEPESDSGGERSDIAADLATANEVTDTQASKLELLSRYTGGTGAETATTANPAEHMQSGEAIMDGGPALRATLDTQAIDQIKSVKFTATTETAAEETAADVAVDETETTDSGAHTV